MTLHRLPHPPASAAPTIGGDCAGTVFEVLAGRLDNEGHPWPRLAAALVVLRGRRRWDRGAAAAEMGVDAGALAAIETGTSLEAVTPDWAGRLRRVEAATDWAGLLEEARSRPVHRRPSRRRAAG